MEELTETLSGLNPVMMLWIAGSLALIFVLGIAFDAFLRNRRRRRLTARSGHHIPGSAPIGISFKNLRGLYRSVADELGRRRRQRDRERSRRK